MTQVLRDGRRLVFDNPRDWAAWLESRCLRRTDAVLATDGRFYLATALPNLTRYLPPPPRPSFDWGGLVAALAVGAGVALAVGVIAEALEPPLRRRRVVRNDERLARWKRYDVWERDGGECVYCGVRVSFGKTHTDHRNPRALGGGNGMLNLATSCPPCNLRKGAMTARRFVRLLEREYA